ncbi:MAG: HDOD domain-containing protein [Candidatus Kapabacteria bacterium]|nr:HDOD domain-containing protein [Candidatus Kapabacteria bacterium]
MDPKRIAAAIDEFPTLPTVYSSLLELLSDMNTKVSDVANLISKDQSTVMKVLKTANSSFYGFSNKVTSITNAITLLGYNEMKNIVLSLTLINLFKNTKLNQFINPVDFWKHSIAVGIVARRLGISMGSSGAENFFLGGLLHDIGKLVIYLHFSTDYGKALQHSRTFRVPLHEAEKKTLGFSHCELGGLIAEKWNMPIEIQNAIGYHDTGYINGVFEQTAAVVHVSNIAAKILLLGDGGNPVLDKPSKGVLEKLNLPEDTFVNNLTAIINEYKSSLKLFLLN